MEPKFQKIISKYDYADQLAPGGFRFRAIAGVVSEADGKRI